MKIVYKYQLQLVAGIQTVQITQEAEVIRFSRDGQGNQCLWALVDTNEPIVERRFQIIGTGDPLFEDKNYKYIGSVEIEDLLSWFVFHCFEVLR